MAEQMKLAVLCGNMQQSQLWVRENPQKAGRCISVARRVYEKAFPVTQEIHIVGRNDVCGIERTGTYGRLPNWHELERRIALAIFITSAQRQPSPEFQNGERQGKRDLLLYLIGIAGKTEGAEVWRSLFSEILAKVR